MKNGFLAMSLLAVSGIALGGQVVHQDSWNWAEVITHIPQASTYDFSQSVPSNAPIVSIVIGGVSTSPTVLRRDGTIASWTLGGIHLNRSALPGPVPAGLKNVKQVATWGLHSLALLEDGSVVGWGFNFFGNCVFPRPTRNVRQVATNLGLSGAVLDTGELVVWGDAFHPCPLNGMTDVASVAMASNHVSAVRKDGTVAYWDATLPEYGPEWEVVNPPANLHNVVQVAAGYSSDVALLADGTVVQWGAQRKPAVGPPPALHNVVQVAAGRDVYAALLKDGTVITWGQINNPAPSGLRNVVQVAVSNLSVYALRSDGTIVVWGDDDSPQLNPIRGRPF